jgi:hypothetical protein
MLVKDTYVGDEKARDVAAVRPFEASRDFF